MRSKTSCIRTCSTHLVWALDIYKDMIQIACRYKRRCGDASPTCGLKPICASIRSFVILFAAAPPCSSDTAPTIAYMACARTMSYPDAFKLSGCEDGKLVFSFTSSDRAAVPFSAPTVPHLVVHTVAPV